MALGLAQLYMMFSTWVSSVLADAKQDMNCSLHLPWSHSQQGQGGSLGGECCDSQGGGVPEMLPAEQRGFNGLCFSTALPGMNEFFLAGP